MTQCLTRNGSLTRKGQLWITGPHSVAQTAPTHLARPAQAQKDPVVRGQPGGLPQRSRLAVLGGQAAASAVPRQDRRVVEGRNLPRLPDPPPSRRRPTVRGWSCCPRHLSAVPCTEG